MVDSKYPFVPRSTAKLAVGDFWPVPLSDGSYAAGIVLQKAPTGAPNARVSFCGGLLDWKGRSPPRVNDLANVPVLAQGYMHILAIKNYGAVLGNVDQAVRPLPLVWQAPGDAIYRGYEVMRHWTKDDVGKIPILEYWGWDIIHQKAEQLLLNK